MAVFDLDDVVFESEESKCVEGNAIKPNTELEWSLDSECMTPMSP